MIKDTKLTKVRINIQDNYILGIFLIIISSLCFALVAVMVKYLRHLPLMEILFFQNISAMIIVPLILKKMHIPLLGNNKPSLLLGGFLVIITDLAKYYTFTVMLLADASTIHKIKPLFYIFLFGNIPEREIKLATNSAFIIGFFRRITSH